MKRFTFFVAALLTLLTIGSTQILLSQNKLTLDPGGDLVSRYVWRGTDFGNSPAIQPALELGYGGFAIGAWGSYAFSANFQEMDLYASYTFFKDMFTITVTDYFFPYDDDSTNYKYYDYDYDCTGHVFEGTISFNGTEKVPLSLMVATNFAGADARTFDNKLQYSTYIELGYSLSIKKTSLDVFLGGTPTNPNTDKGESGYYGPTSGIINIGLTASREIQITEKYALPIYASLITNPQQEKVFFVFGLSF